MQLGIGVGFTVLPKCLRLSDARAIPFSKNTFDVVTVAFGIRNISDPLRAIKESHRVLKNSGKFLCLELMKPEKIFFRHLWRCYIFHIIPFIGRQIIGDSLPYKYLSASIDGFYTKKEFIDLLYENGFKVTNVYSMSCGTANLFVSTKEC